MPIKVLENGYKSKDGYRHVTSANPAVLIFDNLCLALLKGHAHAYA